MRRAKRRWRIGDGKNRDDETETTASADNHGLRSDGVTRWALQPRFPEPRERSSTYSRIFLPELEPIAPWHSGTIHNSGGMATIGERRSWRKQSEPTPHTLQNACPPPTLTCSREKTAGALYGDKPRHVSKRGAGSEKHECAAKAQ